MHIKTKYLVFATISLTSMPLISDVDLPTKFSNIGGIINTRHNMTQATIGSGSVIMSPYRNDYREVCVYCHTPHAASGVIAAPLWNRTINTGTYTTYASLGTSSINGAISQPGASSLTCLSCHDGTLAVDSVINMPNSNNGFTGSGYRAAQATSQNNTFLNTWNNISGPDASVHIGLNGVTEGAGCLACHSSDSLVVGAGATDFKAFVIGTDLKNDHPVGIQLPLNRIGPEFNDPAGTRTGIRFYDKDLDSVPDSDEIRFYDTGDGPEVECASCHDPHGVGSLGTGTTYNASFLRVTNEASGVCLTCHMK